MLCNALSKLGSILLAACGRAERIAVPMNPETFWSIIGSAKGTGGDEDHGRRLMRTLKKLPAAEIVDFHVYYRHFHDQAERGEVWAAGVLLNGGHGSDDGFEYFRNWLIGQGREVYEGALLNPDSLADVEVESDERTWAEWEYHGCAASEAYKSKTKSDLGEAAALRLTKAGLSTPDFNWQDYENEFMQQNLPRLWTLWSKSKLEFDNMVASRIGELQAGSE
jgi:hypothetical protein